MILPEKGQAGVVGFLKIYPAFKVAPDIGVIRMIRTNHIHVNTH